VRSDAERLRDILDAIDQIRKYSARLGEATARLSPSLHKRRSVPWKQIIGMRNILVHQYYRIDPDTVWTAVELHLPLLEKQARKILADLEQE
jgi:uncharacterized protein with HEPN domain